MQSQMHKTSRNHSIVALPHASSNRVAPFILNRPFSFRNRERHVPRTWSEIGWRIVRPCVRRDWRAPCLTMCGESKLNLFTLKRVERRLLREYLTCPVSVSVWRKRLAWQTWTRRAANWF